MNRRKFERAERSTGSGEDANARGWIRVYVRLIHRGSSAVVKGNISKTVTVKDSTVTEVMAAIERALF